MTTDNRTNEPTEAQVEAAAKEFERVWDENIDSFDPEQHDAMSYIKTAMRAALVAAQGAAPQDPERIMLHHPDGTPKSNDEIRSEAAAMRGGAAPQAESVWVPGYGGTGVNKAAPVLPSSGVDEVRLAEVIEMHREVYLPKQGDSGCSCGWRRTIGDNDFSAHRARAVAEWLKGQNR